MTISSSRIRFLDRENKVLVQDFSDLSANIPLTNVETPFSIEDMDLAEAGYNLLLLLQREFNGLLDSLLDGNISEFLVDMILNNLRLNVPGFPALNTFVQSLRRTNPAAFGGLVNALVADASNSIFENPSLINTKSNDVKQQIVNIALSNFAQKLQSGQVTPEYIEELANSGTSDPYQISSSVNKILNDYKYAVNEQDKFMLPDDERVAQTLVCHLSITLGYYNYLYSTIKLVDKTTKASAFAASIAANTKIYSDLINELKSEIAKANLDHDSMFYYVEQMGREFNLAVLTALNALNSEMQVPLISTYLAHNRTVMTTVMSYMRTKVGRDGRDVFQEPSASTFANGLITRIKDGSLVFDGTLVDPQLTTVTNRLVFEYQDYLRHVLYAYMNAGNAYKNQSVIYLFVNARNTLYKSIMDERGQFTIEQLKTVFRILELFFKQDLFALEGDHLSHTFNLRTVYPIILYEKMTDVKFFTVCLKYLQLMERQFYINYPKTGTTGLLSNMVDKMNQVRLDLVKNNFYVRTVVMNPSATYSDLKTVLTNELLQSNFYPIAYNSHDLDIYTLYKRDLNRFVFSSEDVRTT